MKKLFVLIAVLIISGIYDNAEAESNPCETTELKTNMEKKKKQEQRFIEHSDECLAIIEMEARKQSIEGVAMIAYIPGNTSETWVSKMKVVGSIANEKVNFLAVVYAKASEMAVTLKNSGNQARKNIIGETGWEGGKIIKTDSGYLLAAFSGGTSQQDLDAASKGLEWLYEKLQE